MKPRNVIVDFFKTNGELTTAVTQTLKEDKHLSETLRPYSYRCGCGEVSAVYLENAECQTEHIFAECEHCYEDYDGRTIDKHYD